MSEYTIPQSEFDARIQTLQARLKAEGLDAALVHGYECDCAYVRYLSNFWPTFETAGVYVPAEGTPVLLVGPESEKYAASRSAIPTILRMDVYAESAEPNFPGETFPTFKDVIEKATPGRMPKKIGVIGWAVMNLPVYLRLCEELPGVEVVKACQLLVDQRQIKSENELRLLRRAFEISELAIDSILEEIKPGMTELQVIGIAQREIYLNGGEYEGHALYCFSGENTNSGISRPSHRVIGENELIQLNIGARVAGYSSSVGLPFSIGALPEEQQRVLEFGLEAHQKTMDLMQAGKEAGAVVREYEVWVRERGFGDYLMYGPCHGLGMMEVEKPWMESDSAYPLAENMTFQVDTFFHAADFGLRWENGVVVKEVGVERLSERYMKLVQL
jgi:Xaa-Pro aminopeptidase